MCSYYNIIHITVPIIHITVPTCSYSRLCMVLPFVLRFGDQHDSWIRRATQWVGKGERGGHQHLLPGGYWISSSASAFITLRYFVADFLGSKKHFDRLLQQLLSYLIIDVAFQGSLIIYWFLFVFRLWKSSFRISGVSPWWSWIVIWFVAKNPWDIWNKTLSQGQKIFFQKNWVKKHPHVVPSWFIRPKTGRDFFFEFQEIHRPFPQKHPVFRGKYLCPMFFRGATRDVAAKLWSRKQVSPRVGPCTTRCGRSNPWIYWAIVQCLRAVGKLYLEREWRNNNDTLLEFFVCACMHGYDTDTTNYDCID